MFGAKPRFSFKRRLRLNRGVGLRYVPKPERKKPLAGLALAPSLNTFSQPTFYIAPKRKLGFVGRKRRFAFYGGKRVITLV